MFRRWVIYETGDWVTPSRRTGLIKWSAVLERIAEWIGERWRASEPSEEPSLIKHMAACERQTSSVVDLAEMRAILRSVLRERNPSAAGLRTVRRRVAIGECLPRIVGYSSRTPGSSSRWNAAANSAGTKINPPKGRLRPPWPWLAVDRMGPRRAPEHRLVSEIIHCERTNAFINARGMKHAKTASPTGRPPFSLDRLRGLQAVAWSRASTIWCRQAPANGCSYR